KISYSLIDRGFSHFSLLTSHFSLLTSQDDANGCEQTTPANFALLFKAPPTKALSATLLTLLLIALLTRKPVSWF
ncbi:hypothetical protein, partial [Enterovibrio norvegicus]|uniref:hypothetical protein n=1 Tax=Enterovibrio norvegicus TaxID=188144 RepID=UPI001A7E0D50